MSEKNWKIVVEWFEEYQENENEKTLLSDERLEERLDDAKLAKLRSLLTQIFDGQGFQITDRP
jgi:hypothetical protein